MNFFLLRFSHIIRWDQGEHSRVINQILEAVTHPEDRSYIAYSFRFLFSPTPTDMQQEGLEFHFRNVRVVGQENDRLVRSLLEIPHDQHNAFTSALSIAMRDQTRVINQILEAVTHPDDRSYIENSIRTLFSCTRTDMQRDMQQEALEIHFRYVRVVGQENDHLVRSLLEIPHDQRNAFTSALSIAMRDQTGGTVNVHDGGEQYSDITINTNSTPASNRDIRR